MSKSFMRIVSILLFPPLLVDPTWARLCDFTALSKANEITSLISSAQKLSFDNQALETRVVESFPQTSRRLTARLFRVTPRIIHTSLSQMLARGLRRLFSPPRIKGRREFLKLAAGAIVMTYAEVKAIQAAPSGSSISRFIKPNYDLPESLQTIYRAILKESRFIDVIDFLNQFIDGNLLTIYHFVGGEDTLALHALSGHALKWQLAFDQLDPAEKAKAKAADREIENIRLNLARRLTVAQEKVKLDVRYSPLDKHFNVHRAAQIQQELRDPVGNMFRNAIHKMGAAFHRRHLVFNEEAAFARSLQGYYASPGKHPYQTMMDIVREALAPLMNPARKEVERVGATFVDPLLGYVHSPLAVATEIQRLLVPPDYPGSIENFAIMRQRLHFVINILEPLEKRLGVCINSINSYDWLKDPEGAILKGLRAGRRYQLMKREMTRLEGTGAPQSDRAKLLEEHSRSIAIRLDGMSRKQLEGLTLETFENAVVPLVLAEPPLLISSEEIEVVAKSAISAVDQAMSDLAVYLRVGVQQSARAMLDRIFSGDIRTRNSALQELTSHLQIGDAQHFAIIDAVLTRLFSARVRDEENENPVELMRALLSADPERVENAVALLDGLLAYYPIEQEREMVTRWLSQIAEPVSRAHELLSQKEGVVLKLPLTESELIDIINAIEERSMSLFRGSVGNYLLITPGTALDKITPDAKTEFAFALPTSIAFGANALGHSHPRFMTAEPSIALDIVPVEPGQDTFILCLIDPLTIEVSFRHSTDRYHRTHRGEEARPILQMMGLLRTPDNHIDVPSVSGVSLSRQLRTQA